VIYWIVIIGGTLSAVTGYLLMFPFYATDIAGMQLAQIVHGVVAVLFVAAMLAHIYIGTIGMEGASKRWPRARSTRIGPSNTTGSGSTKKKTGRRPARRLGPRRRIKPDVRTRKRPAEMPGVLL
jgi:hypothetical protein